jgi:hypothetical protein
MTLRDFRDRVLLTSRAGQAFVEGYYRISPPVAAFIADHESLKLAVRMGLTPIVYVVKYPLAGFFLLLSVTVTAAVIRRPRKR